MRVVFFGSYDTERHPRVRVLIEGFRARGHEVVECNVRMRDSTAGRVAMLRQPWRLPGFLWNLAVVWWGLWRLARGMPVADLVVVGYMGHFDVHLARRIWPTIPLALDHLISAADTARDRRATRRWLLRLLECLDRRAVAAADIPVVDTVEHLELLPAKWRSRACVVPVGAPAEWFRAPERRPVGRLRVVFFGLFTPLQGTPTIGDAIARLVQEPIDFTMIGTGQDYEETRRRAASNPHVRWIDWLSASELRAEVVHHDVCLGIFGAAGKALRVVPNKVFQGAAAGCAIVTSRTEPQVVAFRGAAEYVPVEDADALAGVLRHFAHDAAALHAGRVRAYHHARQAFLPEAVVEALLERVETLATEQR